MKTMILLVVLGFFCCARGQSESTSTHRQTAEERVQQVLANLECRESRRATAYEGFLEALRRGERGDGVHRPWMDRMRELGVKQVFFVVHFAYRNGEYRYRVKSINYLRHYYCYENEIRSGRVLRQIRQSGLEQELKDAIIARIRRIYTRPYQPGNVTSGELYHYLLDDEHLPIIDFVT